MTLYHWLGDEAETEWRDHLSRCEADAEAMRSRKAENDE